MNSLPDFQRLFEAAPALYLVLSPEPPFRILAASEAYLAATMTRRVEILGRPVFEVFPDDPADPAAIGVRNVRASLERALSTGKSDALPLQHYPLRSRDDPDRFETRYWAAVNTPILDGHGRLAYLLHRVEDVTESVLLRERQARQLAEQQAAAERLTQAKRAADAERSRLFSVFEQAPVPFAVLRGPQLLFEFANEAFRALVRSTRPLVGLTAEQVFATVDEVILGYAHQTLRSGERKSLEALRLKLDWDQDGSPYEKILRVVLEPFLGGGDAVEGVLVTVSDETERITARQQVDTALHDLQQERALRENFVETLSHDLRNPIAAARMGAQLVLRTAADPEPVEKHARRILRNVERADRMIRDLLDANRLRAGKPLPIEFERGDLAALVREVVAELSSVHGRRLVLDAPTSLRGEFDPSGLQRVLENLVVNAIKYGDTERAIRISLMAGTAGVALEVHNEGNPISAEAQANLFDVGRQYGRPAGARSGWGIGLTLVRGVAEAHGGRLAVRSSQESGTTFTVTLPSRLFSAESFPTAVETLH